MKALWALFLLAGCTAPVADVDETPAARTPVASLPEPFLKSYDPGSNIQVGVGGAAMSHAFHLERNATLTYFVTWELPEPGVELRLMRSGRQIDGETVMFQQAGHVQREVALTPGHYEAVAQVSARHAATQYTLGGSFA